MDIGKEQRTIRVEPITTPVPPRRIPARPAQPAPAREPSRAPVRPQREREKVPA